MSSKSFKVRGKVWLYPGMASTFAQASAGQGAWHFFSLPKKQSAEIKKKFGAVARGWGSLRVSVTIGKTTWKTSIFPDKKSGTYLLPLKADVRRREDIRNGDTIIINLTLL